MKTQVISTVGEPAIYQTASPDRFSKTSDVSSCSNNFFPRVVTTKQQTESITVRVTTRPIKLNESTT